MKQLYFLFILLFYSLSVYTQNAQWVIKPHYDAIDNFSEGIAAVKKDGKWGYINLEGKIIAECQYETVYPFSEGIGVVTASDNSIVAIIDVNGHITKVENKLKIDSRFAEFSDGLLLVNNDKNWGYINKSGELSIDCKYMFALPFSEGLAGVRLDYNGDWYYIAPNGVTMIYPGFQGERKDIYWALGFNNGRALILYNKGLGYINNMGKELSEKAPKFSPPDDDASYKKDILQSKDGSLAFNSKGCATYFKSKNGDTVNFISTKKELRPNISLNINGTIQKDNLNWQTNDYIIVDASSNIGVVKLGSPFLFLTTLSEKKLESIFGNSVTFPYTIENKSDREIENLKLLCNNMVIANNISISPKSKKELTIQLEKQNDSIQQSGTLVIRAEEYGLLLGNYELNYKIVDRPSINILVPTQKFEISKSDKTYPLKVVVQNISKEESKSVKVMVNNQTQEISLLSESNNTLKFNIPKNETNINISIKPRKSPVTVISYKTVVSVKSDTIAKPSDNKNNIDIIKGIGETK